MTQAYPTFFFSQFTACDLEARGIALRGRRPTTAPTPLPCRDNGIPSGRCRACNRPSPIAPLQSEYRGGGLIHHYWQCSACGHRWITAPLVGA